MKQEIQPTPRKSNWANQLNEFINSKREEPFEWGVFDCAMFAFGAIDMMTGSDYVEALQGKWKNKRSAARFIKKGKGVEAILLEIAMKHGWKHQTAISAQRGDIMVYQQGDEIMLAINIGASSVAPAKEKGIAFFPVTTALYSYHIE